MSIIDKIDEWADYSEVELQLVGGDKEEIEKYAPAIVGVTDGHWTTSEYNDRVAVVYDEAKMIEIIAKDMEPVGGPDGPDEEYNDPYLLAEEYFSFNIKGSWVGEHTPIFINTFSSATQVSSFPPNLRDPDSEEAMIREDLYLAAQTKATERGISFGKFLEQALELTLRIGSLTEDQFEELFYKKYPKERDEWVTLRRL